ncbi:MAG: sodium:calcium antiporter [Deltaproteobacteria bacterium]|jgi:cation:H+ antiporter|nr:sodium:calcium antiporter [Deltaproteobacteria bacterium]
MNLLLLIVALLGLWAGTEVTVRQALRLAAELRLSPMFVGLTVLAIGTDLPELVLAIEAGLQRLTGVETSGLVVGNAIGSCLGQIGFALGVTGLFGYVTLGRRRGWTEGVFLLGSIAIFFMLGMDGGFTRLDGAILITVYLIYFATTIRRERFENAGQIPGTTHGGAKIGALCLLGFVVVAASSHLAIKSAVALAEEWGIAQTFVGIVLIGIGTSLPELAVSLNAVFKKQGALSAGNILGSNIFDMLIAPGTAAVIAGVSVDSPSMFTIDLLALLAISVLALYFFKRRKGLQKGEASTLVIAYIAYIATRTNWAGA